MTPAEHLSNFNRTPRQRARASVMAVLRNRSERAPRKTRAFTDEQVADMSAKRARGMPWRDIGKHYGISAQAAHHQVFRWGNGVRVARAEALFRELDAISRTRALTENESLSLEAALFQIDSAVRNVKLRSDATSSEGFAS